jgi:hypothetical protein
VQAYFAVSAAITAAALLLYMLVLPRLDVVQYYRGKLQGEGRTHMSTNDWSWKL